MVEFNLKQLETLTNEAIEPYLVSIEQALQAPQNQRLDRLQQAELVKQMFARSMRLIAFNFSSKVDEYTNRLTLEDLEKAEIAKAKKEKSSNSTPTPKKAEPNKKLTLKELRERRVERSEAKRDEAERRNKTNKES